MTLNINSFSDSELLYYGIHRNFPEEPFDNLLKKQASDNQPDTLIRLSENHPEIVPVVDAIVSSVMAPRRTIRVFSGVPSEFLRLRMSQHITDESSGDFAMLIGSGAEKNVLQILKPNDVLEMLLELCGTKSFESPEILGLPPQAISMSILEQLAILGACAVVHQDRYTGGWFTASSICNVFDLNEVNDFSELCTPLAEVAHEFIESGVASDQFAQTLEAMMEAGMLIKRMVDTTELYCFTEPLQSLPNKLMQANERFALFSTDKFSQFHLLYSLTGESGQWCFYANNRDGCLIKTGYDGLRQLLSRIIIQTENSSGAAVASVQKYCTACGALISADSQFCGACGAAIKGL